MEAASLFLQRVIDLPPVPLEGSSGESAVSGASRDADRLWIAFFVAAVPPRQSKARGKNQDFLNFTKWKLGRACETVEAEESMHSGGHLEGG